MKRKWLQGVVKRHPDGFGFLIPEDTQEADVYIPKQEMNGVMFNDRVKLEVVPEPNGRQFRGRNLEVISRATTQVMGIYNMTVDGNGVLYDKGHAWGGSVWIRRDRNGGAEPGDWVAVKILDYGDGDNRMSGQVIAKISNVTDPLNDVKRTLLTHSIPQEFSEAAVEQAKKLSTEVEPGELKRRRDLRSQPFITIDGVNAKDFDDAILVESTRQGFVLYVAIADVSHYVRVGSPIDRDAYQRGTSVYFPNFVVPMLPEQLSNELCSLKPRVPRLAVVAELHLNHHGSVVKSDFYEATIESKARVTYGEAQQIVEGENVESLSHVATQIRLAADLSKILMKKRFQEGSLDLEIPETEIEIDELGNVIDILPTKRLFSHRLIEELMLAANVAVAESFEKKKIPALYRVHDAPRLESIQTLARFLGNYGLKADFSGSHLQSKITNSLKAFEGKKEEKVLHILTLRSMAQAKYSPLNVGHFGLGFKNYTHFTSPIRRYPDLIVHRLLKASLGLREGYSLMSEEDLGSAGNFLSACEQRAVKSERFFNSVKKARFMMEHMGEDLEGTISSVTKFGLFVSLQKYDVDGLLRVEDLGGDYFEFDEENFVLKGKRTGRVFMLGDPIKVQVGRASPEEGQIDFVLVRSEKTMVSGRLEGAKRARKSSGKNYGKDSGKNSGKSFGKPETGRDGERLKFGRPDEHRPDKATLEKLRPDRTGRSDDVGQPREKTSEVKKETRGKKTKDNRRSFRKARVSKSRRKGQAR